MLLTSYLRKRWWQILFSFWIRVDLCQAIISLSGIPKTSVCAPAGIILRALTKVDLALHSISKIARLCALLRSIKVHYDPACHMAAAFMGCCQGFGAGIADASVSAGQWHSSLHCLKLAARNVLQSFQHSCQLPARHLSSLSGCLLLHMCYCHLCQGTVCGKPTSSPTGPLFRWSA